MGFSAPEPPPQIIQEAPEPVEPDDDEDLAELARQRRAIERQRQGTASLRIDDRAGLSIPGQQPQRGNQDNTTGLRIPD